MIVTLDIGVAFGWASGLMLAACVVVTFRVAARHMTRWSVNGHLDATRKRDKALYSVGGIAGALGLTALCLWLVAVSLAAGYDLANVLRG